MHHLVDGAVGPAADLAQVLQVLGGEVPVLLRDLQLPRRLDAVRPQPLAGAATTKQRTKLSIHGGGLDGAAPRRARGLTCGGSGRADPPC